MGWSGIAGRKRDAGLENAAGLEARACEGFRRVRCSPARAVGTPPSLRHTLFWLRVCVRHHFSLDMLAAAGSSCCRRDASPHMPGARDWRAGFDAAEQRRVLLRQPPVADEELLQLEARRAAQRLRRLDCLRGELPLPAHQPVVLGTLLPRSNEIVQFRTRRASKPLRAKTNTGSGRPAIQRPARGYLALATRIDEIGLSKPTFSSRKGAIGISAHFSTDNRGPPGAVKQRPGGPIKAKPCIF